MFGVADEMKAAAEVQKKKRKRKENMIAKNKVTMQAR